MMQKATDKRKLKTRFATLYVVSIILVALIFATFWNVFSSSANSNSGTNSKGLLEESEILKQDALLHSGLKNLQQLDEKYSSLLADSSRKNSLDSFTNVIKSAETHFGQTIDSIKSQIKNFTILSNTAKLDSITSAFTSALNNRKSLEYYRSAFSDENVNFGTDKRELLKLKLDLQNKDTKILALEEEVKKNSSPVNTAGLSDPQLKQQIEKLQASIKENESKLSGLTALNNTLTKDNSRLTAQLNDSKPGTLKPDDKTDRSKNENLQSRIDDLNAELILAKVDCNLSRANAKEIISNSKQRKDLLQESLTSLHNLSSNNSVNIQRKVKEKLNQLQTIVATVHD